jgi:hypothetical protein
MHERIVTSRISDLVPFATTASMFLNGQLSLHRRPMWQLSTLTAERQGCRLRSQGPGPRPSVEKLTTRPVIYPTDVERKDKPMPYDLTHIAHDGGRRILRSKGEMA